MQLITAKISERHIQTEKLTNSIRIYIVCLTLFYLLQRNPLQPGVFPVGCRH
mgnify:FL=1